LLYWLVKSTAGMITEQETRRMFLHVQAGYHRPAQFRLQKKRSPPRRRKTLSSLISLFEDHGDSLKTGGQGIAHLRTGSNHLLATWFNHPIFFGR